VHLVDVVADRDRSIGSTSDTKSNTACSVDANRTLSMDVSTPSGSSAPCGVRLRATVPERVTSCVTSPSLAGSISRSSPRQRRRQPTAQERGARCHQRRAALYGHLPWSRPSVALNRRASVEPETS